MTTTPSTPAPPATLAIGPPPAVAMDYEALRAEALEVLGRLSGGQWTDHNSHDPGITILEQLCFAITELAYRANFSIDDLIASAGDPSWPPPAPELLAGDPVTDDDLASLLEDFGAEALRLVPLETSDPPLFFHETDVDTGRGTLLGAPPSWDPTAAPIRLQGVRQVRLLPAERVPAVRQRLHRIRLLGEEPVVEPLTPYAVSVTATLEVGAVEEADALRREVFRALQAAITPSPRQAMAEIRCSDLLHALLDLPAVRAVPELRLAAPGVPLSGEEVWLLPIPAERVAVLDPRSPIRLLRDGLPLPRGSASLTPPDRVSPPALSSLATIPSTPSPPASPPPAGRRRELTRFRSLRRQLPAVYGVGPAGLAREASAERRALAQQLEAYLLLFDQLLANVQAQLALAPRLLSPAAPLPGEPETSYGSLPLDDPPLALTNLLDLAPDAYATWLRDSVEPADPRERRLRCLAHLLARFGEELLPPVSTPEALLAARREFLGDIARMGGARGSGMNLLEPEAGAGGFAERLRRKLGLPEVFPEGSADPPFLLIEHLLLRPRPEDSAQLLDEEEGALPFLEGVASADPWSHQVTLVVNEALVPAATSEDPEAPATFERRVAREFAAELPVHLRPRLLWFGDGGEEAGLWRRAVDAWRRFRLLLANDRGRLGRRPADDTLAQLAFRDARDQLVDLLAIGRPWPLRDIPLPAELVVTQGRPALIRLPFSQNGVRYELWSATGSAPLPGGGAGTGNGSALTLSTPPVQDDLVLRVRAIRDPSSAAPRATWLRGEIRVIEGIDTTLVPTFRDLPPVAPEAPAAASARICAFGQDVIVDIPDSQNGITYDLVDRVDRDQGVAGQRSRSQTSVSGNGGTVSLVYAFAAEDRDLQVRARRTVATASGEQVALLEALLPLRVRADRGIPLALDSPVAPFGEESVLRLGTSQTKAQAGVAYQLWSQRLAEEAYVTDPFQPPPASPVPNLAVADAGRAIRVARPPTTAEAATLSAAGFTPLGGSLAGNADLLVFPLGAARFDTTGVVLATKRHRLDPLDGDAPLFGTSVVQLEAAFAQLVRPDPTARLTLVRWQQDKTSGQWRLYGGEPGVLHRVSKDGTPLGLEAYVHQRDDQPPFDGRGVGRLRIALNLAIAADPLPELPPQRDEPLVPLLTLDLRPEDLPAKLAVRARRALSGLEADLETLPLLVRVEPPLVPKGKEAKILFNSRSGDTYALEVDGVDAGPALRGDDSELAFTTDALEATTTVMLRLTTASGASQRVPVTLRLEG